MVPVPVTSVSHIEIHPCASVHDMGNRIILPLNQVCELNLGRDGENFFMYLYVDC
jgi:hypothetical protein